MSVESLGDEAEERARRRQGCGAIVTLVLLAGAWVIIENAEAPRRMSVLQAELQAHGLSNARAYPAPEGRCPRHEIEYLWKTMGESGRACVTVKSARLLPDN